MIRIDLSQDKEAVQTKTYEKFHEEKGEIVEESGAEYKVVTENGDVIWCYEWQIKDPDEGVSTYEKAYEEVAGCIQVLRGEINALEDIRRAAERGDEDAQPINEQIAEARAALDRLRELIKDEI